MAATAPARSPNERGPSAELAGLVFVSTTGASSTLMPSALSCAPVAFDIEYESGTENVAPIAMLPGETASGAPIRVTLPPSWSVLISSGTSPAACCSPKVK